MSDDLDTSTALAPAAPATPVMRIAKLGSVVASHTNPRKTFNVDTLSELAEDIKAKGLLHAIVVRRLPASRLEETSKHNRLQASIYSWPFANVKKPVPIEYELVAGERRWRACQLAGLEEITISVHELTDEQVLEIQFTENLQREDVDGLEEAEGLRYLMQTAGLTADQVALRIKKSRRYVFNRTKILDLCQAGREAMRAGTLDLSKAILVARIPVESLQLKALKDITSGTGYHNEPMSQRKASDHIQQTYMLELKKARFKIKDATLLDGVGACGDCPKRTGANPELFDDIKSADVCTDPTCFHKKEEAESKRVMNEAKAKGQTVIVGKAAEELSVSYYSDKMKGYKRLDSAEDSPTGEPLRKIIGKQMEAEGMKPVMIENPRKHGDLLACLPNDVAHRLLKTVNDQANASQTVSKEVQRFADEKKAKAEARAQAQYEQAWRDQLLARTWKALSGAEDFNFPTEAHRYLVKQTAASLSSEHAEAVALLLGLGKVAAHAAVCDLANTTPDPGRLHLLLVMQRTCWAGDHGYNDRPANEGLMLVAGAVLGDRLPVVIRDVKAEQKAKHLPKPVKAVAPKAASTPNPAAQASPTREGAKGKGGKAPAARAGATAPKTSTAEASAQIAAELTRIEETHQAPAAQGNEGQAVADAQPGTAPDSTACVASKALDQAPTAQGDEALTAAPAPAAPATPGQASAGASTGAATNGARFAEGSLVKVKDTAKGPSGRARKCCGKVGVVLQAGATVMVAFGPLGQDRVGLDAGELDAYKAAPTIGDKVRILTPENHQATPGDRTKYLWRQGSVKACQADGWLVMLTGKSGAIADTATFDTTQLEVIA